MATSKSKKELALGLVCAVTAVAVPWMPHVLSEAKELFGDLLPAMFGQESIGRLTLEKIAEFAVHIGSSAFEKLPEAWSKEHNYDLERALALAYLESLEHLANEAKSEELQNQFKEFLPLWTRRIERVLKDETVSFLFSARSEEAGGFSPQQFILDLDEPGKAEKLLADDVVSTLQRWASEETVHNSGGYVQQLGLDDKVHLADPLLSHLRLELPKEVPHRFGQVVRRKEFERSWIAFQQAHWLTIGRCLRELAALNQTLIEKVDRLVSEPRFPAAMAQELSEFLSRSREREAVTNEWLAEIVDRLLGIEGRIVSRVDDQADRLSGEIAQTQGKIIGAIQNRPDSPTLFKPGSAPPLPSLIIGREDALRDLKARLGVTADQSSATVQVLTAVRGWPGVGKTTLASALAHDPEIAAAFPDGILWASLGQKPDLLSELAAWGRALGTDDLLRVNSLEEASARLTALLRNKRMFIIVDDAWQTEHALPFKVGGRGCAMLITTRITSVAQAIAPTAKDVYWLAVLSPEDSLELLRQLAPEVVIHYPDQSLELVRELEGLPLAIQVAGHLLNVEAITGWGVTELLTELREGARILKEKAPAGYADIENQTMPTVAVLLQKSTDYLDKHTRDCFAYLGAFAPKPATFDLAAMKEVWEVDDPVPTARNLVDRGLLEPATADRFQMHALLVTHAHSLLTWE